MYREQLVTKQGYDSMDVAAVWPTSASVAPFPVPELEPISQLQEFRATPAAPDVPSAVHVGFHRDKAAWARPPHRYLG